MYIPLKPLFSRHKGIGVQFTDEPTGNLDEDTAAEITQILKDNAHKQGRCVVVVTHSEAVANEADVVLKLDHGKIIEVS